MLGAEEVIIIGDMHELDIFHTVQLNLLYHRIPASLIRVREAVWTCCSGTMKKSIHMLFSVFRNRSS